MSAPELAQRIRQLLHAQVQCALATEGESGPALHLMAYAVSDDLREVYVASRAGTTKVTNMRARASVALMWDNRTGLLADHVQGTVLTARARAHEISAANRDAAVRALISRNANLESLLSAQDTAVFSLAIEHYSMGTGYGDHAHHVPGPRSR